MTTMGRQISQSGSQSNDNMFMKMMHSAGAQHFNNPAGMQQDNMNYGSPSFDRQRLLRQSRSVNSGAELFNPEPSTPPVYSRCASSRNNDARFSPSDLSPGIFDVHSIDTELLPEVSILGLQDSSSPFLEREFSNDMDLFPSNRQQQGNRPRVPFDSSPLRNVSTEKAPPGAKIKVVVRKRPLNKKEISRKEDDIVTIEPNHTALTVHETKQKVDLTAYVERHEFVFDAVLDERVSNEEVYRVTVEPIVPAIFKKIKATCFAYGQTGSGKTFTMQPLPLKASQDILRLMDQGYRSQGCQLCVSFFEIYGGKLYDLLSDRRKLCMREDGKQQVCIVGLQEFRVYDVETIKELIERGNSARSTGTTGANEESSRSHAILQLVIKKSVDGNEAKPPRPLGKLSFIDLAGSERGADTTDNDRQTRMEGAEINKSLLALKECIRALDNDQVHIPFRGSKLTEVLRDSFVGDSRTVMISCISPNSGSCEHTLNTLRYADRVKSLSKSGNSKKDTTSSTSALRESSVAPLPSQLVSENNLDLQNDYSRFGGYRQSESEGFQQFNMDRGPPSGRKEGIRSGLLYADTRDNNSFTANGNEIYYGEEILEDERQAFVNANRRSKVDRHYDQNQKSSRDMIDSDIDVLDPDDEFSAVYREEVDLVAAHRKQVEDTIDLVKEEMQLLLDIDTPGQPIEGYLTKLRDILSQKAQGILNLQSRLSRFQRILSDQNILAPPATTSKQL